MTALVAIFAVVFALPLFFGSWRLAIAGLGAQATLVLLIMLGGAHGEHPGVAALLVVDLGLVRGAIVPLLLARAAATALASGPVGANGADQELFPGDLLHWIVAAALVALGIQLGVRLSPGDLGEAAHVATAVTEVMLGFAIVAHQRTVLGQGIGMLTIDNGALLFEAVLDLHWPVLVHAGLTAVYVGLVVLVVGFLRRQVDASPSPVVTSPDVEVL